MKKTLYFLLTGLLISTTVFAQDSTASQKENDFKNGFRVHGISYEFGQENLNFVDKNIFNKPFYEFHELGIDFQLGADKRSVKILSLDLGLVDNNQLGAGYYAKLEYSVRIKFLKCLYITPQVGLGSGQFFFHDDLVDPDYYETYDAEAEYPRLFIHTGISGGIDLKTLLGIPLDVFIARQRFNEFWSPYSKKDIFSNHSSTIGLTYRF